MERLLDIEIGAQTTRDRAKVWTELIEEHCMGVECSNAGEDLQASLKIGFGDGGGGVSRSGCTTQTLARTPALIRRDTEENVLLTFVQSGKHIVKQGSRSAVFDGGGTYVLDGTRPFEVDYPSDYFSQSTLYVPKAAITRRVGTIEELAFEPGAQLQKLVSTFAIGMCQCFETLDPATLNTLLNQTLDLFALMAAQRARRKVEPSTHRAGTLVRIKAYIKAHLRDDELTLERTARALGISTRYVNALLAADGTSFGRYLLSKRLDGARREILDPSHVNKHVAEISYDWGFKNTSHFSRAFKERYGLTPRDAKHSEE